MNWMFQKHKWLLTMYRKLQTASRWHHPRYRQKPITCHTVASRFNKNKYRTWRCIPSRLLTDIDKRDFEVGNEVVYLRGEQRRVVILTNYYYYYFWFQNGTEDQGLLWKSLLIVRMASEKGCCRISLDGSMPAWFHDSFLLDLQFNSPIPLREPIRNMQSTTVSAIRKPNNEENSGRAYTGEGCIKR